MLLSAPDAPHQALLLEAARECYLNPDRAREVGHALVAAGQLASGWLHVALAEARIGDAQTARDALDRSRRAFAAVHNLAGLNLCDEIEAILLRRAHDVQGCRNLHQAIDEREPKPETPLHAFIAHNSRAITAKLLGETDDALRAFYAALAAARQSALPGPIATALANLGGYHLDLFNAEDALDLTEQALTQARAINATQSCVTSSANLIIIYLALGRLKEAHALAENLRAEAAQHPAGFLDRFNTQLGLAYLAVGDDLSAQPYIEAGALAGIADGDGAIAFAWLCARYHLVRDEPGLARTVAEGALAGAHVGTPYELLELLRAATDACERTGDATTALAYARQSQSVYEQLVGRSARARHIALHVRHEVDRERHSRANAELALQRVSDLNRALQAKIDETELLHARLREQALRDSLTGLHNRRYLFEVGPGLLELAKRTQEPLAVALLDLDRFKRLNDEFGHEAGDLVLQRFSSLLQECLRRSDVICRHGGEEFVVVMPNTDVAAAQHLLERVQARLQVEPVSMDKATLPPCSFSAGVAGGQESPGGLEQLLTLADRRLYAAKHAGRACITTHDGPARADVSERCVPGASAPSEN